MFDKIPTDKLLPLIQVARATAEALPYGEGRVETRRIAWQMKREWLRRQEDAAAQRRERRRQLAEERARKADELPLFDFRTGKAFDCHGCGYHGEKDEPHMMAGRRGDRQPLCIVCAMTVNLLSPFMPKGMEFPQNGLNPENPKMPNWWKKVRRAVIVVGETTGPDGYDDLAREAARLPEPEFRRRIEELSGRPNCRRALAVGRQRKLRK
ncbi:MAG: hypothetical protein ACI4WT_10820 [Oligosphaeraceae bacterium]